MDIFDWLLTWGNQGALDYWTSSLGWVYWGVKALMYLMIVGVAIYYLWQKKAFCYGAEIYIPGPEKTITQRDDFARIVKKGETVMLQLKKTKVGGWWIFGGKKITIPMQDKRDIMPLTGNFWLKGKIKLYQFGETGYSIVPIKTLLAEGKQINFEPIEPKLSWAESMMRAARAKFGYQDILKQYAPLAIPLGLGIAVIVAALILSDQLGGSIGAIESATKTLTTAVTKLNACHVGEAAAGAAPF